MKGEQLILIALVHIVTSCNEPARIVDGNLDEGTAEAAVSNEDKVVDKKRRDADFVFGVLEWNYSEIKLAELAKQRSRNADVRRIAEMVVGEQISSLNELKTLAQAKVISVPVEEPYASKRMLENIADVDEEIFDRSWCKEMLEQHELSIGEFEERLRDTDDADLKVYIGKALPVLRKHCEHLRACATKTESRVR